MNYKIITTKSMLDFTEDDWMNEETLVSNVNEKDEALAKNGIINDDSTCYLVRFNSREIYKVMTIDEAIQCLDLKNGCDVVQFDNGLFGFVGYNNNLDTTSNRFEIVRKATEEDCENY